MRGRNTGRRNQSSQRQNFESSGPEAKVRGNAQQVVEKYLQLARDATLAGNPVMAENYYQHAEHYQRVQTANAASAANTENRDGGRTQDNKPNGAQNGSGNGVASSAGENGAAGHGEQPDVETAGKEEKNVPQKADNSDDKDNPTPEAG